MKRSLALLTLTAALTLAPAASAADDQAKSNTLTPTEISDGWILLFDGQTPFGWAVSGSADSSAPPPEAANGVLTVRGAKDAVTQTTSEFCCFELTFQFAGSARGTQLLLDGQKHDLTAARGRERWTQARIRAELKGSSRLIEAAFSRVGQKPDEPRELARKDGPARTVIGFSVPAGSQLQLRDVKLKPLGMTSLFNGKNLDGWKILPGHKSKFTVTDKGELNIKDGNGEIQTEGQWADFILQLDAISHGQHLNSGIFFRALPGQFWQGYEAQIRNQWEGDNRTKPVDYGTGGIYNRQPTRKVVPSDKEWFTYTVLADGNHIATWVNGYQTADYFDRDKDADSARRGRYLGKGVISLQGHDPTTDLSFRNIRIQELPQQK